MLKPIIAAAALAGAIAFPGIAAAAAPAVVTTDLNIRTGPSASYQRFGTIPGGTRVTVYGCLRGYGWCDVSWAGERGWVSGNYLTYTGASYNRRPISSIGVTIGLPFVNFEPYAYHRSHYSGRSWYHDRYLNRAETRQEGRELREEKRDVRDQRGDVRDARQDLRDARRSGDDLREPRREVKQERRELKQERKELRNERRD